MPDQVRHDGVSAIRPTVIFATISFIWLAGTLAIFVGAMFGDCRVGNERCFAVHEHAPVFLVTSLVAQLAVTIFFALRQVGK